MLTGQYIAYALEMRVTLLEKILVMLTLVENEITYLNRPAVEIFELLTNSDELKKLMFISSCSEYLNNSEDFSVAWNKSLDNKFNVRFLEKDDITVLRSFGEVFGSTDTQGQISNCRVHRNMIEAKLSEARQKRDSCASLSCGLGVLSGIGVFIILV